MCSIGNKIIIASVLLVIICEFDIVSSVRNRHPGPQKTLLITSHLVLEI
uniref:Uncharacterized protein n=1 Tax=Meloidogyne enterolobii TaxID=390850 RepID=A0A6V7V677_MELEN|nr:unnamed protein product [Meloidogyne enterolobii]